jgi:hypothetical protein
MKKISPLSFPTVELTNKVLNWHNVPEQCKEIILESDNCTIFKLNYVHYGINLDNNLTILRDCDCDYENIVILNVGNYRIKYDISKAKKIINPYGCSYVVRNNG